MDKQHLQGSTMEFLHVRNSVGSSKTVGSPTGFSDHRPGKGPLLLNQKRNIHIQSFTRTLESEFGPISKGSILAFLLVTQGQRGHPVSSQFSQSRIAQFAKGAKILIDR